MPRDDCRIQYHDREAIYYDHEPKPPGCGRGFIERGKVARLRWNSRMGKIYIDGAHVKRDIKIGDEISIELAEDDPLYIYSK